MTIRIPCKTVLFAALLTLATALPALAADAHHPGTDAKPATAHDLGQMGGHGGMTGHGGMMGSMNPYAQLTPEKQAAVAAIDKAYAAKAADIRQRMWAKNAEMEAVLAQPKADRKKAAALSKDLAALQGEMQDAMIDRRIKIAEETGITMPMGKGMMGPRHGRHDGDDGRHGRRHDGGRHVLHDEEHVRPRPGRRHPGHPGPVTTRSGGVPPGVPPFLFPP